MPTHNKGESKTLKYLKKLEKYISRQFIGCYIRGAFLGLFMGFLSALILVWYFVPKEYSEITSVATTWIIYFFILLMIAILWDVYSIYKDMMERKKIFDWLKMMDEDHTEMLEILEKKKHE